MRSLAQFYQAENNRVAARSFYERAIRLAQQLGEEQQEAILLDQLARLDGDPFASPNPAANPRVPILETDVQIQNP